MNKSDPAVFTIGHSTHSTDEFISLLKRYSITLIADVRSAPYSKWQPHFNRQQFSDVLLRNKIEYIFLGEELGARTTDNSCYINGQVQYDEIAKKDFFLKGINKVVELSKNQQLSLMCAEREPLECHRTLLVARALEQFDINVSHIHADGHLESQSEAMLRLLELMRLPKQTLFDTTSDLIQQACKKQENVIAYRLTEA